MRVVVVAPAGSPIPQSGGSLRHGDGQMEPPSPTSPASPTGQPTQTRSLSSVLPKGTYPSRPSLKSIGLPA
ncbi:hypothetical protein VTH06DRAFT_378 [Thermothelomyces fergusii]